MAFWYVSGIGGKSAGPSLMGPPSCEAFPRSCILCLLFPSFCILFFRILLFLHGFDVVLCILYGAGRNLAVDSAPGKEPIYHPQGGLLESGFALGWP